MSEKDLTAEQREKLVAENQKKYLLPPGRATTLTAREWVELERRSRQQYAIRD